MKRRHDTLTERQELLTSLTRDERPVLRTTDRTAKPTERQQLEAAGQLSLPFPPAPPTKAG